MILNLKFCVRLFKEMGKYKVNETQFFQNYIFVNYSLIHQKYLISQDKVSKV